MAKCYDNKNDIEYSEARKKILTTIYGKSDMKIPEETLILELNMKEANVLFRLLGHHVVGVGNAQVLRDIWKSMTGTTVDKEDVKPLTVATGSRTVWIIQEDTTNPMETAPKDKKITLFKDDMKFENCEWFENNWCIVEVDQAGPYVKRRIIDPDGWE